MDLTPEKMKMLRKEKKLSQAEVADFIGVSQVSYGKYETGKMKPKHDTYLKLLDLYGIADELKQIECGAKMKEMEYQLKTANEKIIYLEKLVALYEKQEAAKHK